MRERLKQEALGAVLAWAIAGTALWKQLGTAPPEGVRLLTDDYLADEDGFGQWLTESVALRKNGFERSSELHRNYLAWCDKNGSKPESNAMLSRYLVGTGFSREKTMIGRCFRASPCASNDAFHDASDSLVGLAAYTRCYGTPYMA